MRTARRYLAREIYRSTSVVVLALIGLFTFFTLVDELDSVGDKFPLSALFYLQALAVPVLAHRLILKPNGRYEGLNDRAIVQALLASVPVPR